MILVCLFMIAVCSLPVRGFGFMLLVLVGWLMVLRMVVLVGLWFWFWLLCLFGFVVNLVVVLSFSLFAF